MANEWERAYKSGAHNNSWPWSDLISLYFQYVNEQIYSDKKPSVFEYGSGTGNNYPFFKSLGLDYQGIEFSQTAIDILKKKFPELSDKIQNESFVTFYPSPKSADLIVDRAAITHCNTGEIRHVVSKIFSQLNTGGFYIGVDWFSTSHTDFARPPKTKKEKKRGGDALSPSERDIINDSTGQFAGLGKVHFTDESELRNLFSQFQILHLSHKTVNDCLTSRIFASWSLVARKIDEPR